MIISFKDDEERLFHHILAILSDKNQIMHVSVDTLQTLSFPGLTIQPLQCDSERERSGTYPLGIWCASLSGKASWMGIQ